ncbi:MAG: hypothetical protein KME31_00010 [Tolypothrix carrinoi HA7290-LM1]|jgi:hypothetical protein|nr:hypothetical protein [Tolypothrix carrinoi HA7290-LM1]
MVKILTGEELNELFLEGLQTGTATLYKDDRQILYKGNNPLAYLTSMIGQCYTSRLSSVAKCLV